MATKVSSNDQYVMHICKSDDNDFSFFLKDSIKTLFVHDGTLELRITCKSGKKNVNLEKDQGIILAPDTELSVLGNNGYFVSVQSKKGGKPLIEILDVNNERTESELKEFRVISNPKKVVKPWGHEIWISWFKNHHVLKRIYMIEGNKCSLQYHEEKSETNFIVSGKANVLKEIFLDKGISEASALKEYNKVENIESFITGMGEGDFWDNQPFEIHRVFSVDSYTAYEASTAELDDVIRIQDDNDRASGFIKSEHNY